jgi:hypothetical protein
VKFREEYQHLAESPYGKGMDGAVKAGADGKPTLATSGKSTAVGLRVDAQQAESEASRRAREVILLFVTPIHPIPSLFRPKIAVSGDFIGQQACYDTNAKPQTVFLRSWTCY